MTEHKSLTPLVLQKTVALLITAVLFFVINDAFLFFLVAIVLGYSHFLVGLIYKLSSPRFKPNNILPLAAVGIVLLALFYRPNDVEYMLNPLLYIATLYAIYHTVVDDQFTLNLFLPKYSHRQKLQIWMLVLWLTGLQTYWQFGRGWAVWFMIAGGVFAVIYLVDIVRQKVIQPSDVLFGAQAALVFALYLSNTVPVFAKGIIISFIGIYHYLLFYFHYYTKVKSVQSTGNVLNKAGFYLAIVLASNVLFFGLFFIERATDNAFLQYVFAYNLFLIITLLHFISSTRKVDVTALFKPSSDA